MDQCFIYINLNSPSPVEHPPTKPSKFSSSHSKVKPPADSTKEVSLQHSPESQKKTNRKQYFSEKSQRAVEILEEKPGKRLKTGEILDNSGEKRAVFQHKPANIASKTRPRQHKSRENDTKPEKPIRNEKLSLDEYLKKIEKELNLEEFTHKAENFQKDLSLLEENIQENKILEEFRHELEEKALKNLEEAQTLGKSSILAQKSSENKQNLNKSQQISQENSDNLAETPGFSIDLLKQTINEVKKLKKEQQQQALFKEQALVSSKTKLFLHSSLRNPNQALYKRRDLPPNIATSLKKRGTNKLLRTIYKELLAVELEDDEFTCDVCMSKDFDAKNLIIICELCEGAVHQKCYGNELIRYIPEGVWYCSRCKFLLENRLEIRAIKCMFCPEIKGIIKMVNSSQYLWAHISCVSAIKCVNYLDGKDRDLVNLDEFYKKNAFEMCSLCRIPYGVTINCEFKQCDRNFHVSCAQRQGFLISENAKFQCVCKEHQKLYNVAAKRNFLVKKQQDFKKNPAKFSLFLDFQEYKWVSDFDLHENQGESQEIVSKTAKFEKNTDFDADFMICLVDNEENPEKLERNREKLHEISKESQIEEEIPIGLDEMDGNQDFVIQLAKDDDIFDKEIEKIPEFSQNLQENCDKSMESLEENAVKKPLKKLLIELDDEIIVEKSNNLEEIKENREEAAVKNFEETAEKPVKTSEKADFLSTSAEINNILSEVKRMFMDVSLDL